ncbi:MAG: S8 family serine peptidase [Eubacteriaceae bacterium]|nr:S8 family serine peptidase [Eubacteriaceae bacterium]
MKKQRWIAVLAMVLCLVGVPFAAFAAEDQTARTEGAFVSGEAIFCIQKSAVSTQGSDPLISASESLMVLSDATPAGERITTQSDDVITEIRLVKSSTQSTEELVAALKAKPGVIFAEPNYIYHGTPPSDDNDKFVSDAMDVGITTQASESKAKYLQPDLTGVQYAYNKDNGINVPDWNNKDNVNAKDVIIAVLDTGIDTEHDDLKNILWDKGLDVPALKELGGGKYGINVAGKNTKGETYDTTDVEDDYLHGTHVSGIIGAEWNGIGVSGAANGVKILTVKGLNDVNAMSTDVIVRAFNYILAAKKAGVNIRVVNNSWGGTFDGAAIAAILEQTEANNILSTFAAGNESADCDTTWKYPSLLRNNSVVVVDSSDANLGVSTFSNFGKVTTDVFAPGTEIMSTYPRFKAEPDADRSTPTGGVDKDRYETDKPRTIDFTPAPIDLTVDSYEFKFTAADGKAAIGAGRGYNQENGMVLTSLGEKGSAYACKVNADVKDKPLYLTTRVYSPVAGPIFLFVSDKGEGDYNYTGMTLKAGWNVISANIEKMNLDKCYYTVYYPQAVAQDQREVVLSDLFFTNDLMPYKNLDGTSMACPAVTGEAAILAAKYPGATSEELAAMINGSVRKIEAFGPKSQYGGIADTVLALGDIHAPVLNDLTANNDGTFTLKGYYFGEAQGGSQIAVAGNITPAVASWTDHDITFRLPEGTPLGKQSVTVTTAQGSNSQSYEFGTSAQCYDRLPVPEDRNFNLKSNNALFGIDQQVYLIRIDTVTEESGLWCYSPDTKAWKNISETLAFNLFNNRVCTWNHKAIFGCDVVAQDQKGNYPNGAVAVLDPAEGSMKVAYIPLLQGMDPTSLSFVNAGGHVLMLATRTGLTGKSTGIYEIDPRNLTYQKIADYPALCSAPLLTADAAGNIFAIGGQTVDAQNNAVPCKSIDKLVYTEPGKVRVDRVKTDFYPADWYLNQDFNINGGAAEDGILITGPVVLDDKGVVTQDNYLIKITEKAAAEGAETQADENFDVTVTPMDKIVSQSKMFYASALTYGNHFYAIGSTDNDSKNVIFTDSAVSTPASSGDASIPIVKIRVHGQNYGWSQGWMEDTQMEGTTGKALQLEALEAKIETDEKPTEGLGIDYRVHMADIGWGEWAKDGATAGTTGQARRIEAVEMNLTGEKAANYDIYYRVHMAYKGWGEWVTGGKMAGTTGQCRRIEAIEIQLVPKGCVAPDQD